MNISATYRFDAPRQVVWELLVDPLQVADCLPGCESLEPVADEQDTYRGTLTIGVAAVTGRYDGTVAIRDQVAPSSFHLMFDGRGKAGFAKGDVGFELAEDGDGTAVSVTSRAQIGGTVARVGQRLLGSVGKMVMDRFFACLRDKVRGKVES